jgi:hypothetical protein
MTIADELIAILGYETTGEGEAKRFAATIDSLGTKLDKFATAAGKVAGFAAVAVASGFGLLGKSVVETSAQFESYQATLETIEGSSAKAKASLDWISEFGKTTPYDVAQVTDAFVKLKAYGIDPLTDDALRVLGDTASAMQKPLNQAVEAFADAATGEFERLKEFGIKAKTEGDNVTFAWTKNGQDMTKTVKKSSNEIRSFLLETMGDRFAGAMDKQSKTWNGMMSNLGDTWTDFKRRIGEAGFFEGMTTRLGKFLDYLGTLDKDGSLDRWATNISDVLTAMGDVFDLVFGRIVANITFLSSHFTDLEPYVYSIGAALGFLIARAFPLITAMILVGIAVDDFLAYLQGGESVIGDFIAWIQDMTGVSEAVAAGLAGLGGVVTAALGMAFLVAPLKVLGLFGRLMLTGLTALAPVIMQGAVAAFALLSNPVGWAILLGGVAAGLIWYFWDELVEAWNNVSGKATELFSSLKDSFLAINWTDVGVSMMNAVFDGMKLIGQAIRDWFTSLVPEWASEFFAGDGGVTAQPNKPSVTTSGVTPTGDVSSVSGNQLTPDALDYKLELQRKEWERISGNLNDNLARMVPDQAVAATITDSRQDNRQAPVNSNVTVNQTVNQASDAPRAAAVATGNAVAGAITKQRSQLESEPSF